MRSTINGLLTSLMTVALFSDQLPAQAQDSLPIKPRRKASLRRPLASRSERMRHLAS